MQVVGFNFTKISGEKSVLDFKAKPSTSIEFISLESEKVEMLKDGNIVKINFQYSITYENSEKKKDNIEGKISCDGLVALSVSKEELKEITKSWKKKKLPGLTNIFLFNLILRRCTPKAIMLQDELQLPFHTPMPALKPKRQEED